MIKTDENMVLVAKFFVERMSSEELKDYVQVDIQDEYLVDSFIFQDDSENMERLIADGA